MEKQQLVSIIIPMYNCEQFICQCLDSISAQSWQDYEVILIDDCSSDETVKACHNYTRKDNRFNIICLPENGGPANSRNVGIDASRGQFIVFLDADDWLNPDAIEFLITGWQGSEADMIVSAYDAFQFGTMEKKRVSHFSRTTSMTPICISNYALSYMHEPGKYMLFSHCWGKLFSASLIKTHNVRFQTYQRICEDVHFNFEYLRYIKKITYINSTTYNHRIGNSASAAMRIVTANRTPLLFYKDIWTAYYKIYEFIKEFGTDINMAEALKTTRIGHISHAIVLLLRACGANNIAVVSMLVKQMVNDSKVRENLHHYRPMKGQSRLIPLFMRLKMIMPLIFTCKYKYYKRYKAR